MKKRDTVIFKSSFEFKGKFEQACKRINIGVKQVVIALVLIAFILPINKEALASDKKIKPGKKQATLILSDGRKIVLNTKSDTIVSSQTKGVRIIVDSTGINYMTADSLKKLNKPVQKKVVKKK